MFLHAFSDELTKLSQDFGQSDASMKAMRTFDKNKASSKVPPPTTSTTQKVKKTVNQAKKPVMNAAEWMSEKVIPGKTIESVKQHGVKKQTLGGLQQIKKHGPGFIKDRWKHHVSDRIGGAKRIGDSVSFSGQVAVAGGRKAFNKKFPTAPGPEGYANPAPKAKANPKRGWGQRIRGARKSLNLNVGMSEGRNTARGSKEKPIDHSASKRVAKQPPVDPIKGSYDRMVARKDRAANREATAIKVHGGRGLPRVGKKFRPMAKVDGRGGTRTSKRRRPRTFRSLPKNRASASSYKPSMKRAPTRMPKPDADGSPGVRRAPVVWKNFKQKQKY